VNIDERTENVERLINISPLIKEYYLHCWDGCEDSDSKGGELPTNFETQAYSLLVEDLSHKGCLFHDAAEMCSEGGMRSVVLYFYQLLDPTNFIDLLLGLPTEVIDQMAGLIHSDDVHPEDLLVRIVELLHIELPTNHDLSIVVHYADTYYSNNVFVDYIAQVFATFRDVPSRGVQGLVTQGDVDIFTKYITDHKRHVKFIVRQIMDKTSKLLNTEKINSLLEQHDNDLLIDANLNALALDKALFGKINYHSYDRHPAIDVFFKHKISHRHHIEYYTVNKSLHLLETNEDGVFDVYAPLIIADLYSQEMSLIEYKTHVTSILADLYITENLRDDLNNMLNLVTQLPLI